MALCLCLPITKRLKISSHKNCHTVAQGFVSDATPNPTEVPNTHWVGKICDFQHITRCISETAQERHIVSMDQSDIADELV